MKIISKFSRSSSSTVRVVDDLKFALVHPFDYVSGSEPASISRCVGQAWFLFSDGAHEPLIANAATIGAVLVDPCGRVCSFFGEALDDECQSVFTKSSGHPIYELEILPVVLGVACWKELISGKQLVCYIDNSAAQAAFIGATVLQNWLRCYWRHM